MPANLEAPADATVTSTAEKGKRYQCRRPKTACSHQKPSRKNFTRDRFAWQNTLFGELIIRLINDGKLDLLNSIEL